MSIKVCALTLTPHVASARFKLSLASLFSIWHENNDMDIKNFP